MIGDIHYWFTQMCLAEKNYADAQRSNLNFVTSVLGGHCSSEQGVKIYYENIKENIAELFYIFLVCP